MNSGKEDLIYLLNMLQRDYFMRMTEMLAAVIAKILLKKEIKDYEAARAEIESAAKTIVGIDLKLINMINTEDAVKLLKTAGFYAGKCLICAELLKEYGNIHELEGKENESTGNFSKSLRFYVEALTSEELPEPEKYFPEVDNLIHTLSGTEFTPEMNLKLTDYYEYSGQYSKAEDIFFEQIENNNIQFLEKAFKFYKKLLKKTDEELENGNLSRQEAEESLQEIINKKL